MTQINDKEIVFQALSYYKERDTEVHLKIIAGDDSGLFRNAKILALERDGVIILDRVMGVIKYSLDEISTKIKPART